MSVPKESSITPSTSQQRLYQDALQTLKESRYKQSQASLLILSLNQRMITWGVVTIISSIIFVSAFLPAYENFVDSYRYNNRNASQNLVTISMISGFISVFGGIQLINLRLFKKSLKKSLESSETYFEKLINLVDEQELQALIDGDSNEY